MCTVADMKKLPVAAQCVCVVLTYNSVHARIVAVTCSVCCKTVAAPAAHIAGFGPDSAWRTQGCTLTPPGWHTATYMVDQRVDVTPHAQGMYAGMFASALLNMQSRKH